MKTAYPFYRNLVSGLFLTGSALVASGALPMATAPASAKEAAVRLPLAERLGFWSPSEQESGYPAMEKIFPTNVIKAGGPVRPLPVAPREMKIDFTYEHRPYTIDDFVKANRVAGVLVIKDGQIVAERYGLGRKPSDRWTSFSIAKSVTSTLVGAALRDGKIKNLDDPLARYVPELKGGAYDAVTLRQALAMRSGVGWNEDYNDPTSDFSRYATHMGPALYKRMSAQPRVAAPGTRYYYSTAESNLIGAAVMNATGKSLSAYFSEKIWRPFGMEADAVWMTSPEGLETGGICFSATLRDYGRLGLFMLEGGQVRGKPVLPDGWIADATSSHSEKAFGDIGYGYQWWTGPGESYRGLGIMGQALFVDPKRKLIVVIQSAWIKAGGPERYALQWAFIQAAVDATDRAAPAGR